MDPGIPISEIPEASWSQVAAPHGPVPALGPSVDRRAAGSCSGDRPFSGLAGMVPTPDGGRSEFGSGVAKAHLDCKGDL